ncbi:phosphatase PAP2 family protein [Streptomyces sp. RFCAC02]|uniref:phosphatase PAP2 family protein n=1 Tax=Streptomyces sp. RFCAC02 TaxID=2499143 RepID=UPI0010206D8C|nr:phosphatase PAP2 family protein [Streptomyces sp. RFCAC02]
MVETADSVRDEHAPRTRRTHPAVLGALWLTAAVLAAHRLADVLRLPSGTRLDGVPAWFHDTSSPLYGDGDGGAGFLGTPFAALVLKPFARAAEDSPSLWACGMLALAAALAYVAVRAAPAVHRPWALPAAFALLTLAIPVRETLTVAHLGLLPVLLALAGWLLSARHPAGAIPLGLAAAFSPPLILFAPLLLLTGRRPAAAWAAGTAALATALTWAAEPDASSTYWLHHTAGTGLTPAPDAVTNQSLHGALLRLGLNGPGEAVLFTALAVAVCVLALRRATRYALDGQPLLAAGITGCAVLAATPVAPQHAQIWLLLTLAGRVGRRTGDRPVWPVVCVFALTLHGDALVPKLDSLAVVGENVPLLCAVLAACAVRFLTRYSGLWSRPASGGLTSRPNLFLELVLIRVGYWAYSWVRSYARGDRDTAEAHGHQILDIERFLHIDIEHGLNHAVADTPWLSAAMDFAYASFHFAVPLTILGWLLVRHPGTYRAARRALGFVTLFGLVGFWLYPLAPPRLMPGLGYIDTANGPQDLNDPRYGALTGITNPYAAMPSLHIGWSLWCALILWRAAPYRWLRIAGFAYPVTTAFVIMGTGNHYLLDAVGGVAVVLLGFLTSTTIGRAIAAHEKADTLRRQHTPAPTPPPTHTPTPEPTQHA